VEIPEGLKEIGQCAFADCCQLNGIVIPQFVKGILNWAFKHCIKFTTVKLPLGLKVIAEGTFCKSFNLMVITSTIWSTTFDCGEDNDDESIGWPPGIYASTLMIRATGGFALANTWDSHCQ
jgi:hypothetical protein